MTDDVRQLELKITAAIRVAQDLYEEAEPVSIWDRFYKTISGLPIQQQLLISGEALKELAHVTLLKSESVQSQYAPSPAVGDDGVESDIPDFAGAVLDGDWLSNIVLKTSSLDLSQFAKPDTRLRFPGDDLLGEELSDSVDFELPPLDDSPENLDQILAIAHSESVSDWQVKIMEALQRETCPIDFWALLRKTQLSPSALFLGLFGSNDWYMKKNDMVADEGDYGSILISLVDFVD